MLVIFSDLTEWRPQEPDGLEIDLMGIEVLSVMLNCSPLYSPECVEWQSFWSEKMKSFGAKNIIYINGENIEKNLVEFLRR